MSGYYHGHAPSPGLLLGYAGVPDREIERAVERLAKAFADRIVD